MFDLRMLPHNPVAFFELKTGYDRRDLKRSYGLAIRQYSPEVHASDFQLVRDAYERLEKQLRYGKHQQERSDAANAWSFAKTNAEGTKSANANAPPTHPSPAMPAAPLSPQPQARELSVRQLAVIDPVAALQKLQSQSCRTPQDYYLAAVLADATAGKPTLQYLVQLLEGLASHPTDPGLNALVSEYLRYELPDAKLQNTVQFVAQKLRTAAFYMVTEPLWLRLVNLLPFEQWRSLLTNCEQQIHQTDLAARTTFYLRLLEPAIWVASSAWTDGVLQELERGAASLGHAVQQDLEFVAELHQLLSVHATGKRDDHVRATLLQVFRRACQSDEVVAQREIIDLFSQLGRDASADCEIDGTRQCHDGREQQLRQPIHASPRHLHAGCVSDADADPAQRRRCRPERHLQGQDGQHQRTGAQRIRGDRGEPVHRMQRRHFGTGRRRHDSGHHRWPSDHA